eukprot:6183771-Pleurochrysis_carterae.AAC.3
MMPFQVIPHAPKCEKVPLTTRNKCKSTGRCPKLVPERAETSRKVGSAFSGMRKWSWLVRRSLILGVKDASLELSEVETRDALLYLVMSSSKY